MVTKVLFIYSTVLNMFKFYLQNENDWFVFIIYILIISISYRCDCFILVNILQSRIMCVILKTTTELINLLPELLLFKNSGK